MANTEYNNSNTENATESYYLGAYPQRTEAGTIVYGTLMGPWDDIRDALWHYDDEREAETEISRQGLTVLEERDGELVPVPPEDWPELPEDWEPSPEVDED